jgi:tetratricopeptide (TPR) repeat protein
VLAAIGAATLVPYLRRTAAVDLPPPPAFDRMPPAMRTHLQDAFTAAQVMPPSVQAIGAYCLALHADMFYTEAGRCYDVVIDRSGDWEWVYFRALLAGDLSDLETVRPDLRRVTSAAPQFAPAWLRLGDAEFKAGRYEAAEHAWTRATELPEPERPPSPVARVVETEASAHASLGLARIRMLRGDTASALQVLTKLAQGPPFSSAHRLLAEIHAAAGRDAEARLELARARRLPPFAPYADPFIDRLAMASRNSTLLMRLASEADLALNGPWSEYLARRAVEVDPENPEAAIKLGRVLRTLGRNDEALVYFRRYQEMVPGDLQVLAHIGSALSEMGRFGEAEPLLRRAADALDDPQSYYNLGLLAAMTGRLDEAVRHYEYALARDENHVEARSNLAAVLVRQGRLERAVRELRQVVAIDPENPVARTNLGLVLAEQGDVPGARRELMEAIRLAPNLTQAGDALRALGGA